MDSSNSQLHHQEMGSQTLESMLQACPKPQQEKKPRPADEQALKCPRCDSTNTKFCYYNNYSLSQPRYFCKSCRRYWTKGGTLRNVPVGGGCRRNKRSSSSNSSSTSSSSSSSKRSQDQSMATIPHAIPSLSSYDSNDLSLAIARLQKQAASGQLGFDEHDFPIWGNPQMAPDHNVLGCSSGMMFETFRNNGFLETPAPNGFQNLYYGMENNNDGGMGSQEIGGIPYEGFAANTTSSITAVKQEICSGGSRALWGFPWQNGIGNEGSSTAEFDQPGKLGSNSWINGIGSSNWHGLLNSSPLMSNIN